MLEKVIFLWLFFTPQCNKLEVIQYKSEDCYKKSDNRPDHTTATYLSFYREFKDVNLLKNFITLVSMR